MLTPHRASKPLIYAAGFSHNFQQQLLHLFRDENLELLFIEKSADLSSEYLGEIRPDLIILSLEDNGSEVLNTCYSIKTNSFLHYIPVVIFFNEQQLPDFAEAAACGADEFISSGSKAEMIRFKIKMHLNKRLHTDVGQFKGVVPRNFWKDNPFEHKRRLLEAEALGKMSFWEYNLINNDIFWSEGMYLIFNLNARDFTPGFDAMVELVHEEDRFTLMSAFEQSLVQREPVAFEHRVLTREGHLKHVQQIIKTDFDEHGKAYKTLGSVTDITELKLKEDLLLKKEAMLKEAQHLANMGHWEYDFNIREVLWSEQMFRIFGINPERFQAAFEYLICLIHPEDRENAEAAFQNAISKKSNYYSEHRIISLKGEIKHIIEKAVIKYDREGNPVWALGSIADITERTHIERELKNALEMAEAAQLAKSEFLAVMSHEIRTPLNGVVGFTELLEGSELSPGQKRYARNARTSARNLLNVIDEILDFSKIITGKLEIFENRCDIIEIMENITEVFRNSLVRNNLELNLHIRNHVPRYIKIDPVRFRQIMVNLIGNALKFTQAGKVDITADFRPEEEKGIGNFKFSVRDTGIGIDPGEIEKIFIPFEQADSSDTRRYGGTGLGLSIAKVLVEKMGGHLDVYSIKGKGSEFYFHLKKEYQYEDAFMEAALINEAIRESAETAPSEKNELELTAETSPVVEDKATERENPVILIAEDVDMNMILIKMFIQEFLPDAILAEAGNGEEALSKAIELKPDLILMDIQMPVMDGFTAAKAIRNWEYANSIPRIPIVSLTAGVMRGERQKSFEAGMDDYLTKPVDSILLKAAFKKLIPLYCKNLY